MLTPIVRLPSPADVTLRKVNFRNLVVTQRCDARFVQSALSDQMLDQGDAEIFAAITIIARKLRLSKAYRCSWTSFDLNIA